MKVHRSHNMAAQKRKKKNVIPHLELWFPGTKSSALPMSYTDQQYSIKFYNFYTDTDKDKNLIQIYLALNQTIIIFFIYLYLLPKSSYTIFVCRKYNEYLNESILNPPSPKRLK